MRTRLPGHGGRILRPPGVAARIPKAIPRLAAWRDPAPHPSLGGAARIQMPSGADRTRGTVAAAYAGDPALGPGPLRGAQVDAAQRYPHRRSRRGRSADFHSGREPAVHRRGPGTGADAGVRAEGEGGGDPAVVFPRLAARTRQAPGRRVRRHRGAADLRPRHAAQYAAHRGPGDSPRRHAHRDGAGGGLRSARPDRRRSRLPPVAACPVRRQHFRLPHGGRPRPPHDPAAGCLVRGPTHRRRDVPIRLHGPDPPVPDDGRVRHAGGCADGRGRTGHADGLFLGPDAGGMRVPGRLRRPQPGHLPCPAQPDARIDRCRRQRELQLHRNHRTASGRQAAWRRVAAGGCLGYALCRSDQRRGASGAVPHPRRLRRLGRRQRGRRGDAAARRRQGDRRRVHPGHAVRVHVLQRHVRQQSPCPRRFAGGTAHAAAPLRTGGGHRPRGARVAAGSARPPSPAAGCGGGSIPVVRLRRRRRARRGGARDRAGRVHRHRGRFGYRQDHVRQTALQAVGTFDRRDSDRRHPARRSGHGRLPPADRRGDAGRRPLLRVAARQHRRRRGRRRCGQSGRGGPARRHPRRHRADADAVPDAGQPQGIDAVRRPAAAGDDRPRPLPKAEAANPRRRNGAPERRAPTARTRQLGEAGDDRRRRQPRRSGAGAGGSDHPALERMRPATRSAPSSRIARCATPSSSPPAPACPRPPPRRRRRRPPGRGR